MQMEEYVNAATDAEALLRAWLIKLLPVEEDIEKHFVSVGPRVSLHADFAAASCASSLAWLQPECSFLLRADSTSESSKRHRAKILSPRALKSSTTAESSRARDSEELL